ncbi:Cuticle protein 10.9, partial [Eufriesea mexicana]
IAIVLISPCLGDVSHLLSEYSTTTTPPPPPRPYSFQYQAGRFPGNIDRVQQESGDGAGHVQGSYSFVDPKHKIRTVEYTADETGFHASLINYEDTVAQPVDSEAVKLAKEKHFRLYEKIAEANAHGGSVNLPRDSASVGRAKDRHMHLYQKIAEEHAAIAAQREAERQAYEATSVVNDINPDHVY